MTGRRIYRRGRIWWLRYRDLNYNSRGGFGQVGVGWTLGGLSTITRCPANYDPDGFRGTVSYDANDRFCLDGLRLVSISGAYGADGSKIAVTPGRADLPGHIGNFIDCIRSGARPNADVEEAQVSHILGHMSNISLRVGERRLEWDSAQERFRNDAAANALLKRTYRAPWVVPENV